MTIRKQPSDFRVEELLAPETLASIGERPGGNHVHAMYALNKTSLTTPAAVNEFCRSVKARPDHASYAGLKDKHAQTVQHITVKLRNPSEAPRQTEGKQWSAQLIGFIDHPIAAADITGNRFAITVRDLKRAESEEMDRRAALLSLSSLGAPAPRQLPHTLLFTNYFGAQRFGSARHGAGWIAKSLITGDFETALKLAIGTPARKDTGKTRDFTRILASRWGDWKGIIKDLPRLPEARAIEVLARGNGGGGGGGDFKDAFAALPYFLQSLFIEAYQSHLWNRCAHALTRAASQARAHGRGREGAGGGSHPSPPLLFPTPDEFGEMLFAPAGIISGPLRTLELPLLARNSELLEPWKQTYEQVLAAEGITLADLRVKGLKRPFFGEALRPLFVEARAFSLSAPEPDELSKSGMRKRTATFDLPRGSYATVVMRALGQ
ncbi:MAG: tRNA pseudouridine(13) synthase TruD [Phycisphaerales bacterium]|nr:tRNA pseudouridine(13) synthase TruD [Planctomycetota bacterium]